MFTVLFTTLAILFAAVFLTTMLTSMILENKDAVLWANRFASVAVKAWVMMGFSVVLLMLSVVVESFITFMGWTSLFLLF